MNEANVWAMAAWFRDEGGRLAGARIRWNGGVPSLVAAHHLAAGDTVLKVPRRLCLSTEVARHSPTGQRLLGTRPRSDRAYLGAFLAETRLRGGFWRPMVDALPHNMAHRPDAFSGSDWALLNGSHAQTLALNLRQGARLHFKRARRAMADGLRIPLRDYWWGWQAATMFTFGLNAEGTSQSALAPFGEFLGHSFEANCSYDDNAQHFEVKTSVAVDAGQPLTVNYGLLSNARLFAQYGIWVDDNPHDAVHLAFPLAPDHWLHAYAKELAHRAAAPGFDIDAGFHAKPVVQMMSFLRLLSLGSEAAARSCPALRGAPPDVVPPLNVENETQALGWLVAACESALGRFPDSIEEDDRLLADASLASRQRGAITVRRGEKRLLHDVLALAREALGVLQQPCEARKVALERLAHTHAAPAYFSHLRQWLGDDPPPAPRRAIAVFSAPEPAQDELLSPQERRLLDWFEAQGGRLMGAAMGRRDGLRGMVATRDIAKNEPVLMAPRHLCLTNHVVANSPIGLRLRDAGHATERDMFSAYLVQERRQGGYWFPMVDAIPRRFDGRPEFWRRADFELLEGSSVKQHCARYWKYLLHQHRRVQQALGPAQRMRLREFVWGHLATTSRTFTFASEGMLGSAMVPVAEMFNHSNDLNCAWGGDHSDRFVVHAYRDIAAGTPLTISYGDRGNHQLLRQYGFCIENNPHDAATLWFRVPSDHWLQSFAKDLLKESTRLQFEIGRNPHSEEARRLFSYLRLSSLAGPDDAQRHAATIKGKLTAVPVLDPENERAALQKLMDACEGRLDDFSSSSARDDDLLASGELSPAARSAVMVRRDEKRVLRLIIDAASHALTALGLPEHHRHVALSRRAAEKGPWAAYHQSLHEALRPQRCPAPLVVQEPPSPPPPQDLDALRGDFLKNGFVVVKNAFSPEYIRELQAHFLKKYKGYLEDKQYDDALRVGDKRTMISVELEGPFNRPQLYANDRVLGLVQGLLGKKTILGALGGVASLPGADVQKVHRDHPGLFSETEAAVPLLPPYGITVIVPLVPLTAVNGTTRMYVGSHKVKMEAAKACPTADPYTELGDCVFMDYRTMHRGLPNQSDSVRPILYVVYYNDWFRDDVNYKLQKPLRVSPEEFEKVPQENRHLVDWLKRGVV